MILVSIYFIYLFIYLFLAVLGLRFCARAFSSCGKRGPLLVAVHGLLIAVASPQIKVYGLETKKFERFEVLEGFFTGGVSIAGIEDGGGMW